VNERNGDSLGVLRLQWDAAVRVLTAGLRQEVTRTGFSKVLLGLSGGIDSALVATLAARTFGPENVLAVLMPYASSSPESVEHARLLVDNLHIESQLEEITPQIDAYFATHPEADRTRRGNKMARERMTILYDLSQARNALVLGTSNKTELLLGYSTIFGDSASAVNVIGDLYKSQVFALSRHLQIPEVIVNKAPSADLWQGQTDEDELGMKYAEVDRLLHEMVDKRQRREGLLRLGFAPELIDRVSSLMKRSQFKRKLPVIVKLSNRTVDKDFLYPRDWMG
jgi:NAD+ synthase